MTTHCTLVFLVRHSEVLLGWKKRGFGAQRWNGVGGKIEQGESPEQAMIRECQEEIGVTPLTYEKVAEHTFTYKDNIVVAHTYLCQAWQGKPKETEEMKPQWFKTSTIPYEQMWSDNRHWLPRVLAGQKLKTRFVFDATYQITDYAITEIRESE